MAGFGDLGRAFQKRRKKNASSRRWALKTKKSMAPISNSQLNITINPNDKRPIESEIKASEQLPSVPKSGQRFLYHVVGSILRQCHERITQMWTGFWNAVFFWRAYAQRMEILHQRVDDLQTELQLLHSSVQMIRELRGSAYNLRDGITIPHSPVAAPPPAPPLPPPPPPLPPPPPPPTTIQAPQKLSQTFQKKPSSISQQYKLDRHAAVTLHDLQTVQLRKVTVKHKVRMSPDGRRSPLVTLADLQKVRLRCTRRTFSSPMRPSTAMTPNKSPLKLRVQLKKVYVDRTPGGASLGNKENVEDSFSDHK